MRSVRPAGCAASPKAKRGLALGERTRTVAPETLGEVGVGYDNCRCATPRIGRGVHVHGGRR
jgi:hypothetical protein